MKEAYRDSGQKYDLVLDLMLLAANSLVVLGCSCVCTCTQTETHTHIHTHFIKLALSISLVPALKPSETNYF